ncbi:chemotaxis protein CheB [Pseudanabaena sp. FACHB-2040]|uniref:chemotaxis protein CheB n=1 Tax=Pseudanabaena sp. FACHB-2040 TaxID=2692859 RepID=UPI001688B5A0|nr:chemotaxis protein CheB [Pseudanabaena sp. FACHB-2040]MBD2261187.1 PAS domain-containing protein [Pseudanabaena sp. FACHB-2040]
MDIERLARTDAPFPIVGIAASAGGLEAFTDLLSHLPADTGMAFVLIQHLSPDHESLLSEILGRVTEIPVQQVQDQVPVEPNEIYVIPPNNQMTLENGIFHLAPRQKVLGKYMPGDAFFESLAVDRGNKAIAVVLSGMDGDGSRGLKAVKVAGGVTFAQCEASAKFDSMPNTAVATGYVDFVLPPQAIAAELVTISRSPLLSDSEPLRAVKELPEADDALTTIFALLRTTIGVDFTLYKPKTIERRMQRRMLLYKLESLEEYAQYLQEHPAEVQALYEEILIHVTSFFRDPETFEQLKTQVFPTISQNKTADTPIRIWVAGCSTGEEVYSIAICLLEFFSDRATMPPIQIFATDISETAINRARSGFYLDSQMEAVSAERRNRFFIPLATGGYQISSAVRELCVFARHNLGGDPPFSNLDLISCRNVLIYLSDPLQERIMSLFHYSLNLTGFLVLGTSESVKTASDLFTSVHETAKIYTRKLTSTRPLFSFTTSSYPVVGGERQPQVVETIANNFDLAREIDGLISNRYAPVSVVTNDQMHILHLRGDLDPYLRLSPGTTELDVLLMAREGLTIPLRTALYQAQTQNVAVRQEHIGIETGQRGSPTDQRSPTQLNLEVIPFQPAAANTLYFLVIFEAILSPTSQPTSTSTERQDSETLEREIVQLRQALAAATQRELSAQAHLQAVIQEHSYLNQSLRVANEEILSSNEELQSTNEELQTAKEEILATNEELATTNDELRSRNLQQNRDNSDLNNFVDSISVPILMLTNDLRIRRFTPAAQRLFNFISSDVGRPFNDLRTDFDVSNLESMALEVLETLNTKEQELQTQGGNWYALRIRPYRTTENQIDGVTMVFLDIDALKRHAASLEVARNYAEAIVETVQTPLVVLNADLEVNTVNRSFCEMFQVSVSETVQFSLFELGNGQWNIPQLRSALEEILVNNHQIQDLEVERYFEQIGQKTMLFNACKLQQSNHTAMILLAIEDITERQQFEAERSQLLAQEQAARQSAETANRAKDEFLSNLSHELRTPLNTILGWAHQLRAHTTLNEATVSRALEVIERSARAQTQLIEDILDTSRIISGKLHLHNRPLDLCLVVQAAIETVQLSAEAKNIQIIAQLSSQNIVGDANRLQQVFWNLLLNAIKFTPSNGRIEITLEDVQGQAQIQVTDTGQGISADLLPYIFDRFRQGDSSTTKVKAGLGLGLSIVRYLIELHGGTVQAASPGEGQGATLTVRLPLRDLPQESAPSRDAEPTTLEGSSDLVPSLAGLQILVVDNEVDTCELLKFVLENYGAEVESRSSARDALSALNQAPSRYNMLVCDIGMPEEDGYWLMRQVRLLDAEAGGQIPAVALTAYVSETERQRAIEAGFQRHIAKPVEPEELVRAIVSIHTLSTKKTE